MTTIITSMGLFIRKAIFFTAVWGASSSALARQDAPYDPCEGIQISDRRDVQQRCKDYIYGFLDGASLTDDALVKRMQGVESGGDSSFMDRVYKTRVGKRQHKVPATYYVGYCLPKDRVRKDVVEMLLKDIKATQGSPSTGDLLFTILRKRFPCE